MLEGAGVLAEGGVLLAVRVGLMLSDTTQDALTRSCWITQPVNRFLELLSSKNRLSGFHSASAAMGCASVFTSVI